MTSYQIGLLKSIGLLCKFFAEPILCLLADISSEKLVFAVCILLQMVTMEIFRLVQPLTFGIILTIKMLRMSAAPSSTFTSSFALKVTEGSSEGYGQQRVFGSIAWGLGAIVAGYLIDSFGMHALFYYSHFFNSLSFFIIVTAMPDKKTVHKHTTNNNSQSNHSNSPVQSIADENQGLLAFSTPEKDRTRDQSINIGTSPSKVSPHSSPLKQMSSPSMFSPSRLYDLICKSTTIANFSKFFENSNSRILLINTFWHGLAMCVGETFLYISIEKDFAASRTYSGLCTTISILACIPLFWFSDNLVKRFGHKSMITVSQLSCALRLFAYSMLPLGDVSALKILLFIQLLHGLNFALFWAAAVDAIFKLSPKELSTSCLSSLNVIFFTMAAGVGNLLWGYLYDYYGGVFRVYLLAAIVSVVNALYFYYSSFKVPSPQQLAQSQQSQSQTADGL